MRGGCESVINAAQAASKLNCAHCSHSHSTLHTACLGDCACEAFDGKCAQPGKQIKCPFHTCSRTRSSRAHWVDMSMVGKIDTFPIFLIFVRAGKRLGAERRGDRKVIGSENVLRSFRSLRANEVSTICCGKGTTPNAHARVGRRMSG